MLSIDEAISHCLEVAGEQQKRADIEEIIGVLDRWGVESCRECAADHRQLAEWLTDYKELKNSIGAVKLKDMKEAVRLLQELNTENDQLTSQLTEAKKLLKEALIIAKIRPFCDERYCDICKNVGCEWGEDCFEWEHEDEALALIGEDSDAK